jgi:hypothetical protein
VTRGARTSQHRRLPSATTIVVLAAALCSSGCAGGDFGRTRSAARNDDMHSWIGREATASVGAPASSFQLTDRERQMRDLAYPLIEPPHSRPAWKSVFGNYAALPSPWRQDIAFDHTAYGKMLIDEPHRSHTSRYSQLMDDVRDDLTRFEVFYGSAVPVLDMDGRRSAGLKLIGDVTPRESGDAVARMRENAMIVQWVHICLQQRVASYRYALERLVLHAPDQLAADADRLIGELATRASAYPLGAPAGRAVVSKG